MMKREICSLSLQMVQDFVHQMELIGLSLQESQMEILIPLIVITFFYINVFIFYLLI